MGSRCSGRLLSRTRLFLDGAQPGYKASPNFSSQHIWAGRKAEKHRSRVCWDRNPSVSTRRLATYHGPWELQLRCHKSRTGPRGSPTARGFGPPGLPGGPLCETTRGTRWPRTRRGPTSCRRALDPTFSPRDGTSELAVKLCPGVFSGKHDDRKSSLRPRAKAVVSHRLSAVPPAGPKPLGLLSLPCSLAA